MAGCSLLSLSAFRELQPLNLKGTVPEILRDELLSYLKSTSTPNSRNLPEPCAACKATNRNTLSSDSSLPQTQPSPAASTAMPDPSPPEPVLDIERHLKYWKMCLQAPLPHHYLSNEGNRMALAYFIINSIAILTPTAALDSSDTTTPPRQPLIPPQDRRKLRQWVLSHQHPGGGFSATSSLVFPVQGYEQWEPETGAHDAEGPGLANLPATLFALQLLALLADEGDEGGAFRGVDRVQTLRWLRRLQREDGSFGEVLRRMPGELEGQGWFIGGGYDMRYCYIAASIRWMLRGAVREGETGWVEDFDAEGLARYIQRSQVCS